MRRNRFALSVAWTAAVAGFLIGSSLSILLLAFATPHPVEGASCDPNTRIHALHVRCDVYMLAGAGCNISVQVGEEYVLVVDTSLPEFTGDVIGAVRSLANLPILFFSNTNSDPDHTGGNEKLCHAGWSFPSPDRVDIVPRKDPDKTHLTQPPGASVLMILKALNIVDLQTGIENLTGHGHLSDRADVLNYRDMSPLFVAASGK
jgi:hypothetical protein